MKRQAALILLLLIVGLFDIARGQTQVSSPSSRRSRGAVTHEAITPQLNPEQVQKAKEQNVLIGTQSLIRLAKGLRIAPGMTLNWTIPHWTDLINGTGVFIGPGLILTVAHVTIVGNLPQICKNSNIPKTQCFMRIMVRGFGGDALQEVQAEIVYRSWEYDIMILSVPVAGPPPAHLALRSDFNVPIFYSGNRAEKLNDTVTGTTFGRLSGAKIDGAPYLHPLVTFINTGNSEVKRGNSGSLVRKVVLPGQTDSDDVVGMVTAKTDHTGYMIPVEEIWKRLEFLRQTGILQQIQTPSGTAWALAPPPTPVNK